MAGVDGRHPQHVGTPDRVCALVYFGFLVLVFQVVGGGRGLGCIGDSVVVGFGCWSLGSWVRVRSLVFGWLVVLSFGVVLRLLASVVCGGHGGSASGFGQQRELAGRRRRRAPAGGSLALRALFDDVKEERRPW